MSWVFFSQLSDIASRRFCNWLFPRDPSFDPINKQPQPSILSQLYTALATESRWLAVSYRPAKNGRGQGFIQVRPLSLHTHQYFYLPSAVEPCPAMGYHGRGNRSPLFQLSKVLYPLFICPSFWLLSLLVVVVNANLSSELLKHLKPNLNGWGWGGGGLMAVPTAFGGWG